MVPLLKTTYRIISQARSFVLDLRYDCDQVDQVIEVAQGIVNI